MNKAEIIALVALKADLSKTDAEKAINEMLIAIEDSLVKGEEVKLSGFGGFETRVRKPRLGVSPKDGKPIEIPGGRTIVFKPSKLLKQKVQ